MFQARSFTAFLNDCVATHHDTAIAPPAAACTAASTAITGPDGANGAFQSPPSCIALHGPVMAFVGSSMLPQSPPPSGPWRNGPISDHFARDNSTAHNRMV